MSKKSWVYCVLLAALAFFAMKALFHPGYFTSHDGWHQVARLYHFDQAIRDGHIPPYWAGGLLNGAGYPLFLFNYHVPWFIAEVFVLFGLSIFDGIKITFLLGFVLSGLIMYLWQKAMWGEDAAFIGSFLYLYAPYRFLNIFVRGALGEATSFIFLPLLFWALHRLEKGFSRKFLIIGAIGVAGLILSHAMMVYLVSIPLAIYFLTLLYKSKTKKKYILYTLIALSLGFGLSSYYIFPAIYYQSSTMFTQIMKGLYKGEFVDFSRLLYSPWHFGFSTPGLDAMSLQLGIAQWVIVAISLAGVLLLFFQKKEKDDWTIPLGFILSLIFSIFLMLKISLPIWQLVDSFIIIDFPWRTLAVAVFLVSVLAGWIVTTISNKKVRYTFIIIILIITLYTNRNYLRVNEYTNIPLDLYIASEKTSNTHDEYLPKWADRDFLKREKKQFIQSYSEVAPTRMDMQKNTTIQKVFSILMEKEGNISVNVLEFPGWKSYVDKKEIPTRYDGKGLIQLNLPKGTHSIELRFDDTPVMKLGKLITAAAIGVCIFLL